MNDDLKNEHQWNKKKKKKFSSSLSLSFPRFFRPGTSPFFSALSSSDGPTGAPETPYRLLV